MANSRRIQIEFSNDAIERLNKLMKNTNSKSYVEVIRNALKFYEWKIKSTSEGYDIGLVDKNQNLVKIIEFIL